MKRSERKKLYRGRRQPAIYSRTEESIVKRDYKKGFLLSLLIILTFGLIYFLFFSPFFRVNGIEVNNLQYGDKSNLERIAMEYQKSSFFNSNMITFNTKILKETLEEQSGVRSAKVVKLYPNKIAVKVEERKPSLIWQAKDRKYLVDDAGTIWGDYEEKFKEIPVVIDLKNLTVEKGQAIVPESFASFVADLHKDYEYYTETKYEKMEVEDTIDDLKVSSDSGWFAFFDTKRTAKTQLINLSRILNEAKTKNKKIEYIDLRIDNRIFYKYK